MMMFVMSTSTWREIYLLKGECKDDMKKGDFLSLGNDK